MTTWTSTYRNFSTIEYWLVRTFFQTHELDQLHCNYFKFFNYITITPCWRNQITIKLVAITNQISDNFRETNRNAIISPQFFSTFWRNRTNHRDLLHGCSGFCTYWKAVMQLCTCLGILVLYSCLESAKLWKWLHTVYKIWVRGMPNNNISTSHDENTGLSHANK